MGWQRYCSFEMDTNKRTIYLSVAVCLLFISVTGGISLPAVASGNVHYKILPLGDSITAGRSPTLRYWDTYRYPLFKKLVDANISFEYVGTQADNKPYPQNPYRGQSVDRKHEGYPGRTVDYFVSGNSPRLTQYLSSYTPDIALVHLGTNNILGGASRGQDPAQVASETVEKIRTVIALLRNDNPNIIILLAQITPISTGRVPDTTRVTRYNAQLATVARSLTTSASPIILVDQFSGYDATQGQDVYDGLHPNESGSEKMAQRWFTAIASLSGTSGSGNRAPRANNDSVSVDQGASITINVLSNDSDPDGDALTIASVTQGNNGSVSIVNNKLVYAPDSGFSGTDSFGYTNSDGNGGTASALVTVNVVGSSTNVAPVASDDSANVNQGQSLTIDVLGNDSDPDGDALTITRVSQANNGSVSIVNNKTVYVPDSGFSGGDTFTYSIDDGNGHSDSATVTVIVNPVGGNDNTGLLGSWHFDENTGTNAADSSENANIGTLKNGVQWTGGVRGSALSFDGDDDYVRVPGDASLNATSGVTLMGWFNHRSTGGDGVTGVEKQGQYRLTALTANATSSQWEFQFSGIDGKRYPVRTTTPVNSDEWHHIAGTFDGSMLRIYVDGVLAGSRAVDVPVRTGNAEFRIGKRDSNRYFSGLIDEVRLYGSARSAVEIAQDMGEPPVNNHAPKAIADAAVAVQGQPVEISVLANDTDADGDTLTIITVGATSSGNGVVSVVDGSLVYVPAANFSGNDNFSYTIADGRGLTATAMVTVNVASKPSPDVAAKIMPILMLLMDE